MPENFFTYFKEKLFCFFYRKFLEKELNSGNSNDYSFEQRLVSYLYSILYVICMSVSILLTGVDLVLIFILNWKVNFFISIIFLYFEPVRRSKSPYAPFVCICSMPILGTKFCIFIPISKDQIARIRLCLYTKLPIWWTFSIQEFLPTLLQFTFIWCHLPVVAVSNFKREVQSTFTIWI